MAKITNDIRNYFDGSVAIIATKCDNKLHFSKVIRLEDFPTREAFWQEIADTEAGLQILEPGAEIHECCEMELAKANNLVFE